MHTSPGLSHATSARRRLQERPARRPGAPRSRTARGRRLPAAAMRAPGSAPPSRASRAPRRPWRSPPAALAGCAQRAGLQLHAARRRSRARSRSAATGRARRLLADVARQVARRVHGGVEHHRAAAGGLRHAGGVEAAERRADHAPCARAASRRCLASPGPSRPCGDGGSCGHHQVTCGCSRATRAATWRALVECGRGTEAVQVQQVGGGHGRIVAEKKSAPPVKPAGRTAGQVCRPARRDVVRLSRRSWSPSLLLARTVPRPVACVIARMADRLAQPVGTGRRRTWVRPDAAAGTRPQTGVRCGGMGPGRPLAHQENNMTVAAPGTTFPDDELTRRSVDIILSQTRAGAAALALAGPALRRGAGAPRRLAGLAGLVRGAARQSHRAPAVLRPAGGPLRPHAADPEPRRALDRRHRRAAGRVRAAVRPFAHAGRHRRADRVHARRPVGGHRRRRRASHPCTPATW